MQSPQRLLRNFFNYIAHHPDRILDWLMVFGIAFVLVQTLVGIGGYLPFGATLVGPLETLWWLTLGHAAWLLLHRGKVVFRPWALLPLPLILWGGFEVHFVSSAPWWGGLTWVNWLAAWLLFWIVAHQIRTRLQLLWLFVLCTFIGALAMGVGLYQDYFAPHWFPIEGRERAAQYAGRAAGFFAIPNNLAAFLLLTWPATVVIAAMRRFPGPLRLFSLGLAIAFLVAIVSTGSRGGMIGLIVAGLILPWLLVPKFKQRVYLFCWFLLGGIFLLTTAYLLSLQFRSRIMLAVDEQGETTRPVMWEAALNMLGDNPVAGQGLGGFEGEWDMFRPAGPASDPHYAHSDYLQLGAETGVVGLVLGAGVGLSALFWLFLRWRRLSYVQMAPGQDVRVLESVGLSKPQADRPTLEKEATSGRRRKRKRKHKQAWATRLNKPMVYFTTFIIMMIPVAAFVWLQGLNPAYLMIVPIVQALGVIVLTILRDEGAVQRTTSGKVIGLATLVGLLAVCVHAVIDFPFQIPAILWMAAVLLALGLRATAKDDEERHLPRPVLFGMVLLTFGAATWTYVYGAPRLQAQNRYYLAMESLHYAERNTDLVLRDPALVGEPLWGFHRARVINPGHGAAWLGEGRAKILQNQADLNSREAYYGERALPLLERGHELYPEAWEGYLYRGLALWMMQRPDSEVRPLLEAAVEHAPQRPQVYVTLADYLWSSGGSEERVKSLLDAAYALDPNYRPLLDLRLRIGLD